MTRKLSDGTVVIEVEEARRCDRCGEDRECRDVFDNGSALCFGCTTEEERRAYMRRLLG